MKAMIRASGFLCLLFLLANQFALAGEKVESPRDKAYEAIKPELDSSRKEYLEEFERQKQSANVLDDETKAMAIADLDSAREQFDKFADTFCRGMSRIYGGAWAGEHAEECISDLQNSIASSSRKWEW